MLDDKIREILQSSKKDGWVMEPEAKRILSMAGMNVPEFAWVKNREELESSAANIGYPLIAKVVSPKVVHKSDSGGVVAGIENDKDLAETFSRFSRFEGFSGMLIEEMVSGLELIVGAKIDYQFGPVVLLGMGGTRVEIYKDTTLRMAPLRDGDIQYMISCLKAHQLLEGYRGKDPVDVEELHRLMLTFSDLVMDLAEEIDTMDLNPVICSTERCVVADVRIMLK